MKTLITVSLLLCGKLLCAQQDTIVLDSSTIKSYPHNYRQVSDENIPDYVKTQLSKFNNLDVYRTYCALEEFPLSNGSKAFLFAINEKNYDCTTNRTNYYIASKDLNAIGDSQFFLYDVFSTEDKGLIKTTVYSARLINGQFLHRFGEKNSLYSINDLFQPNYVPTLSVMVDPMWPQIALYDGPIVSINWNPEWFISTSCIWGPTLAVYEFPKAKVIPPEPFDFEGYFTALNKGELFASVLSQPYNAVFVNSETLEKGCFELSEIVLLGQLKEVTKVVHENKKS